MNPSRLKQWKHRLGPVSALALLFLLALHPAPVRAEAAPCLADCARIDDDARRLECYDRVSGRTEPAGGAPVRPENGTPSDACSPRSYLTRLWDLNEDEERNPFTLMPHRGNWFLPVTYNNLPNRTPFQDVVRSDDVQETEVKFQLSLKVKLWQDVLGGNGDLWFGYTQRSFWQLYNVEDSAPFRETDYEPELLLNFRTNYRFLGLTGRTVTIGFNHQSNGRSEPFSRSWNRLVANLGFEKGDFVLEVKTWYRLPENEAEDDNPDLDDFMGPGEIWGHYLWRGHRFGVMLRNNLRSRDNRGALMLEWSFPLLDHVSGHLQYFTGYGESLLDYNHAVNRIGFGFILKEWE
ncbi:MAG: phospholipase A [Proteobacteria bacterium]|nr:phospholipase A [Pseudomonadota bacterium]